MSYIDNLFLIITNNLEGVVSKDRGRSAVNPFMPMVDISTTSFSTF